jgi:urocanate hydratase
MRNKSEKQMGASEEALISQAKAAEMCGVTRAAINDLVRRGRLRSLEVEGRDLVYFNEVVSFSREYDKQGASEVAEAALQNETARR